MEGGQDRLRAFFCGTCLCLPLTSAYYSRQSPCPLSEARSWGARERPPQAMLLTSVAGCDIEQPRSLVNETRESIHIIIAQASVVHALDSSA